MGPRDREADIHGRNREMFVTADVFIMPIAPMVVFGKAGTLRKLSIGMEPFEAAAAFADMLVRRAATPLTATAVPFSPPIVVSQSFNIPMMPVALKTAEMFTLAAAIASHTSMSFRRSSKCRGLSLSSHVVRIAMQSSRDGSATPGNLLVFWRSRAGSINAHSRVFTANRHGRGGESDISLNWTSSNLLS
jgi:hypothetical protein